MRSLLTTCVGLVLASRSLAAPPLEIRKEKRSFALEQIPINNHVRDGGMALRKAYGKYSWDIPEALQHRVPASKAADPSDNKNAETQFLVPVSIAGQDLVMNLDTGSSDMWVFSSGLPESSSKGHTVFDPSKSSTFKPMSDASYDIVYGDDSYASGKVGTDTVYIGGVLVKDQAIGLATTVSHSFISDVNSDGLVGLGFGTNNQVKPNPQRTFFENAMPTLEQPLFTATLKRGVPGAYEFGYINTARFQAPLHNVSVDNSVGWWQFTAPQVIVGEKQINTENMPFIADTGTSILLLSDEVVKAYYEQVEGSRLDREIGGMVFPCDANLPDLGIVISDSYTATIPGSLMIFSEAGSDGCFGAVQSNDDHRVQILGDTFFNAQFVVFDGGNMQLGMAPHA